MYEENKKENVTTQVVEEAKDKVFLEERTQDKIAIAGTIGTGLFLGSGSALAGAGPLGALIAYALVGTVSYSTICSVGEMATWAPVSGTFPHFAARWVDPAFGFAVGWNYYYNSAISTPVEVTAAGILLTFWDSNIKRQAIYIAVVSLAVCSINVFGVRYFGEAEFSFSCIKSEDLMLEWVNLTRFEVTLIIGLLLAGLVIDLGGGPDHDRIGFKASASYWKNPGAINRAGLVNNINTDRFLAILSVIVQASFSFQGMELVALAASETESPRRNIAKAVVRVFYRITIFYILGILMIGMLVAYDDPNLLQNAQTATQSPFVIAFNTAGVKVLPHIINACIFTSAFSAGNSSLFSASRVLYGLALRGQAPKVFTICTKNGLPIVSVLTTSCFVLLAFLSVSSDADTVFIWLASLTTTGGFVGWFSINLTYIFFRRGMVAQGFDLRKNTYNNRFQPYIAYWGCFWTVIFILINGFPVFFNWNVSGFLTAYNPKYMFMVMYPSDINVPIFIVLYVSWKFIKRTSFWKPHEMDFVTVGFL
ncbi:general amino acid permease 1 [Amanita muscaria]